MFHSTLVLFRHCFWGLADVISTVLVFRIVAILRKAQDEKWRRHLSWVIPLLIAILVDLPYRTAENIRYFCNLKYNSTIFDPLELLLSIGGIFGLLSTYRLFRLLREQVVAHGLQYQNVEAWPAAAASAAITGPVGAQNAWEHTP